MRRHILYIAALLLLACPIIRADEEFWFESDQPGFGTGANVVPFKKVMLEVGFQTDIMRRDAAVMLPEVLLRAGITHFAEIRLNVGGFAEQEGRWNYNIDPLVIGTKVRFAKGNKWIPKIAMLAELAIPCTPAQAAEMTVAPALHLLFENEVTHWLNICYDVGGEWDGVDMRPDVFISLAFEFNFHEKAGAFLESYNYITAFGRDFDGIPALSTGFYYQVHKRVQLDVYGSFNILDPDAYSNVGLGVSWLIN